MSSLAPSSLAFRRRSFPFLLGSAAGALALCSCDQPTEPPGTRTPGFAVRVISGAASDTISAILAEPLTVEVHDTTGQLARGVQVAFRWEDPTGAAGNTATTLHADWAVDTTDRIGRAHIYLRLGQRAGTVPLTVWVPSLQGLRFDSVAFTVRPGAPAQVVALPKDTAVFIGGTTQLRSTIADRGGNPVPGAVTYAAMSPNLAVTDAGRVAGDTFGRAAVLTRAGAWADTTWVSVVPAGTLAATVTTGSARVPKDLYALAVLNLDGSGYRRVAENPAYAEIPSDVSPQDPMSWSLPARWDPTGTRLLFFTGANWVHKRLYVSDAAQGGVRRVLESTPLVEERWPTMTADGAWIYFTGTELLDNEGYKYTQPRLWRVHPDGTGAEPLAPASPGREVPEWEYDGAVSPDGTRIAYTANTNDSHVRVRDVRTGVRSALDVFGFGPRWSPAGDWLAYVQGGSVGDWFVPAGVIHLVRPDGTGDHAVGSSAYWGPVDWSPDGRYLVAKLAPFLAAPLEIIDVTTGVHVPLPFTEHLSAPAWRPTVTP
jgi:WD40-like Beta Propeller Repeat